MSQQVLDLRGAIQITRKHRKIFGLIVLIGLVVGIAYAVLRPPMVSSEALVVLPQIPSAQGAQQSNGSDTGAASDSYLETQVVIAGGDPVLIGALPHVSPPMSLQSLRTRVQVASVAGSIVSFAGDGKNAAQAESVANAVANSYISYITSRASPVGVVQAKMLEPATTASGVKLPEQVAIDAAIGLLGGVLAGFLVALMLGRGDRKLIEREAIANSIGIPVLTSLPVRRPGDAGAWAKLLREYEPDSVHSWGLTRLLQQLGVTGDRGTSVTVLSLASDRKALALGPQLAAFASAQGVPTALVLGPQQDENATATLRTACAAQAQSAGRGPLQVIVSDDGRPGRVRVAFTVVVMVVDGKAPSMPDETRTTATVLGVSAGAATAEQLARVATAAAIDGREITGILVADPDPTDQTTGRIPRMAPSPRRQAFTQNNDIPTESRR